MSKAKKLQEKILSIGGFQVKSTPEIKGEKIAYAVFNGESILAIGEGNPERLKGLMKGKRCKKHTKAFLVGAYYGAYGGEYSYYYIPCENKKESKKVESNLKQGVGDFYLDRCPEAKSLAGGSTFLWEQIKSKSEFDKKFEGAIGLAIHDGDVLYLICNKFPQYGRFLNSLFNGYYRIDE